MYPRDLDAGGRGGLQYPAGRVIDCTLGVAFPAPALRSHTRVDGVLGPRMCVADGRNIIATQSPWGRDTSRVHRRSRDAPLEPRIRAKARRAHPVRDRRSQDDESRASSGRDARTLSTEGSRRALAGAVRHLQGTDPRPACTGPATTRALSLSMRRLSARHLGPPSRCRRHEPRSRCFTSAMSCWNARVRWTSIRKGRTLSSR